MKTKNKILAIVQIAIVLCSVFFVASPVIAAEQATQKVSATASIIATSSEDDSLPLGIYGNANEDDTIDMGDVVYTKLAIFGKKPKTELCDAKYDGRINVLDIIQTKLIILGKEKEITIVDSAERIVTVKKPIKRIVITNSRFLETLKLIKVPKDIIVGVTSVVQSEKYGGYYKIFYPEFQDTTVVDSKDPESIITLNPDAAFFFPSLFSGQSAAACEAAGITVLRFYVAVGSGLEEYLEEIIKFGYIIDKRNEAEEFRNFYEDVLNQIKEVVEYIPKEDKPKVYYEGSKPYTAHGIYTSTYISLAGGRDILPETSGSVDPEAVIVQDPDIIIKVASSAVGGYGVDRDNTIDLEKAREEVMSRPELQKVKAVKDGKVYILTTFKPYGAGAGCKSFIGIAYMAKWFHHDLFEDLDPNAIHQEYLTRFLGLDYDLNEHGVFVYHPEEHPNGQ